MDGEDALLHWNKADAGQDYPTSIYARFKSMKGFWETVRLLRVHAGYRSARAFHRAWRLRDPGACGYKAYCEIEAGRLIPTSKLASRLATALSVHPGTIQAEAFRGAYLFSVTHSRTLAKVLLNSLRLETRSASLTERVLSAGTARRRHVMTEKQRRLVVENPEARLSLIALQARARPWTPADMARALGLNLSTASNALRRLAEVGLARGGRGAYICPQWDRNIVFPKPTQSEIMKMGSSAFGKFPIGPWSRQCVVLFRAGHDGARRFARQAARTTQTAHALQRRSGSGGIFSVGAFVWRIS